MCLRGGSGSGATGPFSELILICVPTVYTRDRGKYIIRIVGIYTCVCVCVCRYENESVKGLG